MSLEDFKEVFRVVLGIDNVDKQIERLFMKIDTSSDGYIDWDEFCSYMQLEYAEKEAVNRRAMEVQFELPVSQSRAIKHGSADVRVIGPQSLGSKPYRPRNPSSPDQYGTKYMGYRYILK